MSDAPVAVVIRTAGTNCDHEMARGFELAGARAKIVHLDRLIDDSGPLDGADLVGLPGGFSYGDDIASGRIFALRLRRHLFPALRRAAERGCPMIAACNGFQVAVQAGLLPGPVGGAGDGVAGGVSTEPAAQELSLAHNSGGRFVDRWVRVVPDRASVCIWTRGLGDAFAGRESETLLLPVAHGEGRLVGGPGVIERLAAQGQVALRYDAKDNPNGSTGDIAGICDPTGRIFGLMPHPERYLEWNRHPFWTRLGEGVRTGATPGLMMFANAVRAVSRVGVTA